MQKKLDQYSTFSSIIGLDTIQIGEEVSGGVGVVRKRSNAAGYKKIAVGFEPIRKREIIALNDNKGYFWIHWRARSPGL